MKRIVISLLLAAVAVAVLAQAKPKKPKATLPAVFNNASYVYVEAYSGDAFSPDIFPEDRQAIYDVEKALQEWGRYSITTTRDQADLVFVVRKGRLGGARIPGIAGNGGRLPGGGPGQRDPFPNSPSGSEPRGAGVDAEIGSPEDTLWVFLRTPSGSLGGHVWMRSVRDGLDRPGLPLFKQIKQEVDTAYPK